MKTTSNQAGRTRIESENDNDRHHAEDPGLFLRL